MGLDEDFQAAADSGSKSLPKDMSNDDKQEMYALFKQGSTGDCDIKEPNWILDAKGHFKWKGWTAKKGMSQEDAKKAYIALIESLKAKYKV